MSSFLGSRLSTQAIAAPRSSRSVQRVQAAAMPAPAQAVPIKKLDNSAAGEFKLALHTAPEETASHVVHRYMVYFRQNNRAGTASTKTRSEVRGGGKKPYTQKKTGNARRGSQRSPLMPGGGILFGPKPRDWSIDMNTKERRLAMATALQSAASHMTIVESFDAMAEAKTKTLVNALSAMGANPMAERVLLVTKDLNETVSRSARNVEHLTYATIDSMNINDILVNKKIVLDKAAAEYLQSRYTDI